jgi:energy-coupling factor transport system substrate-specific component
MTWIAASSLILCAALVAGFAWYERTHPSSRVLALVATLAALAALGRIAFAPLPNVKPTTDIVLISGYVLGGAPGFVVGAVAALASNLFFGQGPWTPWQMVAWGGVGVAGALLARAFGRRLGRVPLAIVCGLAGLAFGAVMNLHLWVTYSGDHTTAKLLATFATSFPFDVAHAIGNVAFCLAFGPALVRALERFRTRMDVTWLPSAATVAGSRTSGAATVAGTRTSGAAAVAGSRTSGAVARGGGGASSALGVAMVAAAALAVAPAPAHAESADAAAAKASLRYLAGAQNRDGGWGGAPGQSSSGLYTGWAALGLAAAGRNPRDTGSPTAIDYTRAHAKDLNDLGELSRTILLYRAAGLAPRVGGRDLVAALLHSRRADGSFARRVNTTAFAAMALRAAGRSPSSTALRGAGRWIASQVNPDGGFNFSGRGGPSGIDDTGAAIQGLVAAGRKRTKTVARAVRFIVTHQNADGGFALQPGGSSNAQSTAWAVQGLLAAGREPSKVRRSGSRDPMAYLRSLTAATGEVRYSRTSRQTPVWVTAQAVMALARKPLPLKPVRRARRAAQPSPTPATAPAAAATPAGGRSSSDESRVSRAARAASGSSRGVKGVRDAKSASGAKAATGAKAAGSAKSAAGAPASVPVAALAAAAFQPARAHQAGYVAGLAASALL